MLKMELMPEFCIVYLTVQRVSSLWDVCVMNSRFVVAEAKGFKLVIRVSLISC